MSELATVAATPVYWADQLQPRLTCTAFPCWQPRRAWRGKELSNGAQHGALHPFLISVLPHGKPKKTLIKVNNIPAAWVECVQWWLVEGGPAWRVDLHAGKPHCCCQGSQGFSRVIKRVFNSNLSPPSHVVTQTYTRLQTTFFTLKFGQFVSGNNILCQMKIICSKPGPGH